MTNTTISNTTITSFKHSHLCRIVSCLLILTFTITNLAYGYDKSDIDHLRQIRYAERASVAAIRTSFAAQSQSLVPFERAVGRTSAAKENIHNVGALTSSQIKMTELINDIVTYSIPILALILSMWSMMAGFDQMAMGGAGAFFFSFLCKSFGKEKMFIIHALTFHEYLGHMWLGKYFLRQALKNKFCINHAEAAKLVPDKVLRKSFTEHGIGVFFNERCAIELKEKFEEENENFTLWFHKIARPLIKRAGWLGSLFMSLFYTCLLFSIAYILPSSMRWLFTIPAASFLSPVIILTAYHAFRADRKKSFSTRLMEKSDIDEVFDIEEKSFFRKRWEKSLFSKYTGTENNKKFSIVIEHEGYIIGFICFEYHKRCVKITNFAIHPDFRGEGAGEQLLDEVISVSLKQNQSITVFLREANLPAQLLFTKKGFRALSTKENMYMDPGEDGYHLTLVYRHNQNSPEENKPPTAHTSAVQNPAQNSAFGAKTNPLGSILPSPSSRPKPTYEVETNLRSWIRSAFVRTSAAGWSSADVPEEIVLNGEGVDPQVLRETFLEISEKLFFFTAKIHENVFYFGYTLNPDEDHCDFGVPEVTEGVFIGFANKVLMDEKLPYINFTPRLVNAIASYEKQELEGYHDESIKLARIFIYYGFPESFPLLDIMSTNLERSLLFEEPMPKTLRELADMPLLGDSVRTSAAVSAKVGKNGNGEDVRLRAERELAIMRRVYEKYELKGREVSDEELDEILNDMAKGFKLSKAEEDSLLYFLNSLRKKNKRIEWQNPKRSNKVYRILIYIFACETDKELARIQRKDFRFVPIAFLNNATLFMFYRFLEELFKNRKKEMPLFVVIYKEIGLPDYTPRTAKKWFEANKHGEIPKFGGWARVPDSAKRVFLDVATKNAGLRSPYELKTPNLRRVNAVQLVNSYKRNGDSFYTALSRFCGSLKIKPIAQKGEVAKYRQGENICLDNKKVRREIVGIALDEKGFLDVYGKISKPIKSFCSFFRDTTFEGLGSRTIKRINVWYCKQSTVKDRPKGIKVAEYIFHDLGFIDDEIYQELVQERAASQPYEVRDYNDDDYREAEAIFERSRLNNPGASTSSKHSIDPLIIARQRASRYVRLNDDEEKKLLELVKEGNGSAVDILVDHYYYSIFRWAHYYYN